MKARRRYPELHKILLGYSYDEELILIEASFKTLEFKMATQNLSFLSEKVKNNDQS
jgi:hypothetical protein